MLTVGYVANQLNSIAKNLSDEERKILETASEIISSNFHYYEPTDKAILGYGLKDGPLYRSPKRSSPDRNYLPNP